MNKKVLITGGAGFIGYFLASSLSEENYNVVLLDNFARGNKNVRFLKGWRFNIFGKLVQ